MLLKNGHLVDPAQALDQICDIRMIDGVIDALGTDLSAEDGEQVVDLTGKIIMPGLIDTHVHLREPGREDKEDLLSGTMAAVAGGFTTVVAMPNTTPPIDRESLLDFVHHRAKGYGYATVLQSACITKGQLGEEITEIGLLHKAGAIAFTDDGRSVARSSVMRRALDYGKAFDVLFMSHCEDLDLHGKGVMNEGIVSTELGLAGSPNVVEDVMIMRDIMLAGLCGSRLHISHLSTKSGAEHVRRGKAEGIQVSAEVTPHHLFLTEEAVRGYNTDAKVCPPLRTKEDNEALIEALKTGVIDCIGTDHAPHTLQDKELEFDYAANGISSIEVALPLVWTNLYQTGRFTLSDIARVMSQNPAKILRIARGSLAPGMVADIVVIDPSVEKTVDVARFYSKGKNCPYQGMSLTGWPDQVYCGGRLVVYGGVVVEQEGP